MSSPRLLSTLRRTTWDHAKLSGIDFATDTSYSEYRTFTSSEQLKAVMRLARVKRKLTTTRAYLPWLVNLIVRRSLHDTIGEHVPVILYAKSAQPAHAGTTAARLWARLAREGIPKTTPWPAEDSEAPCELLDDEDFEKILKDARNPNRVDRNWIGGHPLAPWCVVIGDAEMAQELLMDLRQRGPTYGGSVMREDLPPELGGWGHEVEASLEPLNPEP